LPIFHKYVCTSSYIPVCWVWITCSASLQLLHVNNEMLTIQPLTRVKTNGTVIIYYKYNLKNILFFSRLWIYPDLKKSIIVCNIVLYMCHRIIQSCIQSNLISFTIYYFELFLRNIDEQQMDVVITKFKTSVMYN